MKEINTFFICLILGFNSAVATDYYHPQDYGSESLYSPFGNFLSYSFDVLQLPDNFGTANFSKNAETVTNHLLSPNQAIENEGGYQRFVNRQIFPIDPKHSNDSYAALPNYALHMIGGGMVYRKDLEWFKKNNYKYPTLSASTMAMTAEFIQEVFEKNTTADDDEIADMLIFRPLGMVLFHNDKFANFFMEQFDPAIWPSLQAYDINKQTIANAGIHYIYRPKLARYGNTGLFIYTGINNMLGLSHKLDLEHSLSWATGLSTQKIDLNSDQQAQLKHSLGIFYDRNKSLLASLVINDSGGSRFRFNLYPTNQSYLGKLGYFITQNMQNEITAGIVYNIQFGIGFSN